jgi:hypothetical protein
MNNKAKVLILPIINIAALTVMIVGASPLALYQLSIAQQQQQQQSQVNQTSSVLMEGNLLKSIT